MAVIESERLWPERVDRPAFSSAQLPHLGRPLALLWIGFLAVVFMFEPAPNPAVHAPAWVTGFADAFMPGLLAAALLARFGLRRWAAGLSLAVAGVGMVLGWECRATAHHAGGWWLFETAGSAAIAAVSFGYLLRARRSTST